MTLRFDIRHMQESDTLAIPLKNCFNRSLLSRCISIVVHIYAHAAS